MSSIAVVVGFAVMLFLPCAIALMGGREPKRKRTEEFSPYSDRVVNAVVKPVPPVIEGAPIAKTNAIAAVGDVWTDIRDPSLPARDMQVSTRDLTAHVRDAQSGMQQVPTGTREIPVPLRESPREPSHRLRENQVQPTGAMREAETYGREPLRNYLGRVEHTQMEVAEIRAIAARAQAEALAAVARSAIMHAEAAAVEADDLEEDAAEMMRESRRAA